MTPQAVARPLMVPVVGRIDDIGVKDWMGSYKGEKSRFKSFTNAAELKLREAIEASHELGQPNRFTTAVCMDLLDELFRVFPRYSALLDQMKEIIHRSIYTRVPSAIQRALKDNLGMSSPPLSLSPSVCPQLSVCPFN